MTRPMPIALARPRRRSFVLLEVTLSLIILAVAMAAVLRAFVIGFDAIKMNKVAMTASVLAEALLDDLEIVPPGEGKMTGTFEADPRFGPGYERFTWEREVEIEEPEYDDLDIDDPLQELEVLYRVKLRILYDTGRPARGRRGASSLFAAVNIETYLIDAQSFSDASLQGNQLF